MRWSSDVKSSWAGAPYNMMHRLFDMRSGIEVDCSNPDICQATVFEQGWGNKLSASDNLHKMSSVYIANGTNFGFFLYETFRQHTVKSVFDWETLVSYLSVGLVLIRWVLGLLALHFGVLHGKSQWFGGGIGCVSGAKSFELLPVVSLPHLKMVLASFWTVGCQFEGQQSGLSEAWFVIYPAIAHFILLYFSLLNILAKMLRRRISDVLFAPTVLVLCLLHYFRLEIAESGWLKGYDGRIPTVVVSDEVEKIQLVEYFMTDLAWRMNGRVALLFWLKVAIVAVNFVPLLLARPFPKDKHHACTVLNGVEKALALRVRHVGGLGRSVTYIVAKVDRKKYRVSSRNLPQPVNILQDAGSNTNLENRSDNTDKCTRVIPFTLSCGQYGVGHTSIKQICPTKENAEEATEIILVNSYELIRLGFLVFGDKYLITFDEWDLLTSIAPFKHFCHLWNHRVLAWKLRSIACEGEAEIAGGRALQSVEPQVWRLDDSKFQKISWRRISACSIQC
ncbi:unnamed protein product [Phytophthora fragariaefolia]|uniref:Unnamed protein product n=1 Tax=Phytophthora fragariaefolia TaxID=1490495 RepID=A0A9W6Y2K7_9STRA|nr:unnamed protein product [Phytophthora fragariaefolia]